VIVVVAGVSGCGKTTVGTLLAKDCGWAFHDADDFHSAANVAKMKRGAPLTDDDRWPWLDRLARGCAAVRYVFLDADAELIRARLASRKGHYMNPTLLDSQFAILELPQDALRLDAAQSPAALAGKIRTAFAL